MLVEDDFWNIPAVTATSPLLALLGAIAGAVAGQIAVNTLHLNTINCVALLLASSSSMAHFYIPEL